MADRKPMVFVVTLVPPPRATAANLRVYVEDAVATLKGSYPPDDPIFWLDGDRVKARPLTRKVKL